MLGGSGAPTGRAELDTSPWSQEHSLPLKGKHNPELNLSPKGPEPWAAPSPGPPRPRARGSCRVGAEMGSGPDPAPPQYQPPSGTACQHPSRNTGSLKTSADSPQIPPLAGTAPAPAGTWGCADAGIEQPRSAATAREGIRRDKNGRLWLPPAFPPHRDWGPKLGVAGGSAGPTSPQAPPVPTEQD